MSKHGTNHDSVTDRLLNLICCTRFLVQSSESKVHASSSTSECWRLVEVILRSLPMTTDTYFQACAHCRNAKDYFMDREHAAGSFELRLLLGRVTRELDAWWSPGAACPGLLKDVARLAAPRK